MTSWQRLARLGAAAFGIGCGVVVYYTFGERPHLEPSPVGKRLDARAVAESTDGKLVQLRGLRRDYVVKSPRIVSYDDGTTRFIDVTIERIEATNDGGAAFVVTAGEGRATKDHLEIELIGEVVLRDSDGLELRTDRAMFYKDEDVVRAAGEVTFGKGRMSGSGTGMTYTLPSDVLTVAEDAAIDVKAGTTSKALSLRAGTATLDRVQHVLVVERNVRGVQGEQVTRADRATARLSSDDDVITFVELRGNADVERSTGPLATMRAREIDLDYTDDGELLERSVLTGAGTIAMRSADGAAGRQFSGDVLDLAVAPDGSVTRVTGEGAVRMTVPASAGAPARRVDARSLAATGPAGRPLHVAVFTGDVVFREALEEGEEFRVAKAQSLTLEMSSDAVSNAVFRGGTTFEEGDLDASAAEARYVPSMSTLRLSGTDARGVPRLSDRRIAVDAESIDVGLKDRRIVAAGRVKTSLQPGGAAGASGAGVSSAGTRLPGLLRQDEPVNVTAGALTYVGSASTAAFSKGARLWQGDTAEIRAETLDLQQERGDLIARGSARSTIAFDSGRSDGHADQIQYVDAERLITYLSAVPAAKAQAIPARMTGPQGDVRGRLIEVRLAPGENRVERVDAVGDVTATVGERTATGDTLKYRADDETYHVTGTAVHPMTVAESCSVWTGRTLIFSGSADTMVIDGQAQTRTQSRRRTSCP